ncbi:MAG: hypothetical protein MJZ92_05475 [Paludibacteraceae bacterium]|nr:hypothetical protein [Paludibacteraceae bacterium]
MKKILLLLFLCLSLSLFAVPLQQDASTDGIQYLNNIFYYVEGNTATIYDAEVAGKGKLHYDSASYTIAPTVFRAGAGTGSGGAGTIYTIVALGKKAFYGARNLTSISFADNSNVRLIDSLALANLPKMAGTLVLPASLDSLSLSAIVLPNIQKIVFLGSKPPHCAINKGSLTVYNPWTSDNDGATPADIEIEVPDDAKKAYKAAAGIGDYFDYFTQETPTAMDNAKVETSPATKSLRNGMLIIERDGKTYNALGGIMNFELRIMSSGFAVGK